MIKSINFDYPKYNESPSAYGTSMFLGTACLIAPPPYEEAALMRLTCPEDTVAKKGKARGV